LEELADEVLYPSPGQTTASALHIQKRVKELLPEAEQVFAQQDAHEFLNNLLVCTCKLIRSKVLVVLIQ
jgi:hypothetical protein